MENVRIVLSASWVALMFAYLLGDVLRLYSGDFVPGAAGGFQLPPVGWLGIAIMLSVPIVMVILSLTLTYPLVRWATLTAAIFLFLFNLIGLPTYPSAYDKFLIMVGLGINIVTIWYAWKWAWKFSLFI